ncbi:uncharacterized protein N7500_008874, partial [Penicillium coprophilum]|uniref:uncharacterized protein n=1 Tax=Penicillium coprophilum TaxID=36646 RepID=UPI00238FB159
VTNNKNRKLKVIYKLSKILVYLFSAYNSDYYKVLLGFKSLYSSYTSENLKYSILDYILLVTIDNLSLNKLLRKLKVVLSNKEINIYNKLFSYLNIAKAKLKNKVKKKLSKYYTTTKYKPYSNIYALVIIFSLSKKV